MSYTNSCGNYSGGCGSANYAPRPTNYSSLESMVGSEKVSYMAAEAAPQQNFRPDYDFSGIKKELYANTYASTTSNVSVVGTNYTSIDSFLDPSRPKTVFVGEAKDVKEFVEDAFFKMTGKQFPDDVVMRVVSEKDMEKMHKQNVLGFAINRKSRGLVSEIFIKKDMLDRMMITIGHELGHVLTRRLESDKDEEAKAFAFSIAWMKTIKEHNIANLSTAIRLDAPAKNGLHNVALDFVLNQIQRGREAMNIYLDLIAGIINIGGEIKW